ncbi:MAG: hypothetical protein RBS34_13900 [Desulfofustis sp.]|nr:hypothetical protein [Desulfofustis sp.]
MKKVLALALVVSFVGAAQAYEIDAEAEERSGFVTVSGRISGDECKNLRVKVFAQSDDGDIISCTNVVELFGNSTFFECKDRPIYKRRGLARREWAVTRIVPMCL